MSLLAGTRVVVLGGIGPTPFCAMLLADYGADVVRIDPPVVSPAVAIVGGGAGGVDVTRRGQQAFRRNLKDPADHAAVWDLLLGADVLVEGFRPGVAERLGFGPELCRQRNPRLIYGRMTGWGQSGPLAHAAGHDANYMAIGGALASIPRHGDVPFAPLNLVGDIGGGAMLLTMGILAALVERHHSGVGQVIDAAMCDGAALMMAQHYGAHAADRREGRLRPTMLDGRAPFYECYACADDGFVVVAAIEPQFFDALRHLMDLPRPLFDEQLDEARWPEQKAVLVERFRSRTRAEWAALLQAADACATPVLDMCDAPDHPHNVARGVFVEHAGACQPAPAPRFSRTPATIVDRPDRELAAIAAAWRDAATTNA